MNLDTSRRVPHTLYRAQRGVTVMLVIAFMGIFLLIMGTITGYAFEQSKYGRALYGREQALGIAEAGLEYYRWFLAHNPSILVSGAGLTSPYTYTVSDPEGGTLGSATVTATANLQCGIVQSIDLTSKGTSNLNPGFPRTIAVRHMRPSVAQYSYLLNGNVWFGGSNVGAGPYFSNGGIRMDGQNGSSTVSSSVATWTCTPSFGCSPSQSKPGVWGSGNSTLWQYPVASIDFNGMTTNLSTLKGYAQASGLYFYDASVSGVASKGFHLVLNSNGTITVYKVTGTTGINNSYHIDDGQFYTDYDIIANQTLLGTYTPPSTCSLIYVQGTLWIDGTASGKYTVVAADPSTSFDPDALLSGNISYATADGSTGLTVIAEHSVRVPLDSSDTFSMRGVFVASNGYFGRDYYDPGSIPSAYASYALQSQITITGSIVSKNTPVLCWSDGTQCVQGYTNRTNAYDRILAFQPPPFTPVISTDYSFVLWREQQ